MKYYIYIDYTTKPELGTIPFYVGKGVLLRTKRLKRNKKHIAISNKYGINRQIVFFTDNEQEAFNTETYYIKEFKTYYLESQYGCNFTTGGEGSSGHKLSNEQKIKISERFKSNKYNLGRQHNKETKDKMSISRKGNKNSLGKTKYSEDFLLEIECLLNLGYKPKFIRNIYSLTRRRFFYIRQLICKGKD